MMKGLLFDINGTIVDILTDEGDDNVYRVTANFLDYYGVHVPWWNLKELYFELNHKQRHESKEEFPEFDVSKIFQDIIQNHCSEKSINIKSLADNAAIVFRSASRYKLEPYPGVVDVLSSLQNKYKMAVLSDGQTLWALPELKTTGLDKYFSSVTVSGDYGYRKPDSRFFKTALDQMGFMPEEVIFVGNDMYRDVYGAKEMGMKTVFFKSNQGDHSHHGAEPDYIIYHFGELPRAIDFLTGGHSAGED